METTTSFDTNSNNEAKKQATPVHSIDDLRGAVLQARAVQETWATVPLKQRTKRVLQMRRFLVDHIDELADVIAADNGKTRVDAMAAECVAMTMAISYYCRKAPGFLRDKKISAGNLLMINKRSVLTQVPYGVVGIISPWNYPASIPFSEIIPALLAGNAVIFKGASETPAVSDFISRCIKSADLPRGLFHHINMPGRIAGDAFLEAGIDKLFFTGSVSVGKYLMKKASETLTPLSLELGGNDPMIVCEDADLYRAAKGAVWAGLQNAGQSCGGVERIYVHKAAYVPFLDELKREVEALRIGLPSHFDTDIGEMTTSRQLAAVNRHVEDALEKGATVFARSEPPDNIQGRFLPCLVLTDVHHEMLLMKEETFGPVLGVMPFEHIDEAVALANDSDLGLTASVWSRNTSKARGIARRLMAGAVTVNDHLMSHGLAETPWGGFKNSGIGRTHGHLGFAEMTRPRVIINDALPGVRRNFWWHPYSRKLYDGLRGITWLLYGRGLMQHLRGAVALLKVFPRTFRKT